MENVVFIELMRLKNLHPDLEIFYWHDSKGEVDFIVDIGGKKAAIQVTYDPFAERETKQLQRVGKKLGAETLLITWGGEEGSVSLFDFLLDPEKFLLGS